MKYCTFWKPIGKERQSQKKKTLLDHLLDNLLLLI